MNININNMYYLHLPQWFGKHIINININMFIFVSLVLLGKLAPSKKKVSPIKWFNKYQIVPYNIISLWMGMNKTDIKLC